MSDENIQSAGGHNQEGFEAQDLQARSVFGFLIALAIVGVIVYFVVTGLYSALNHYQRVHETPQNPLRPVLETDTRDTDALKVSRAVNQTFPEPRLENDERNELTDFRLQEEGRLNSYGWVDQQAGIMHIPIDRAMQLIAQRGLPVASPPATANGAKETKAGKKP